MGRSGSGQVVSNRVSSSEAVVRATLKAAVPSSSLSLPSVVETVSRDTPSVVLESLGCGEGDEDSKCQRDGKLSPGHPCKEGRREEGE